MVGPLDMTVPELLKHWAKYRPDLPALIFHHHSDPAQRTVITFKELYMLGLRCATLLKSRGVRRKDVVIILLPNSPERAVIEAAILLLAAFSLTATCQEVDGSDLLHLIKRHHASVVILDSDLHRKEWTVLRGACQLYDPIKGHVIAVSLPHLCAVMHVRRYWPPTHEKDFLCYLKNVCVKMQCAHPAPYAHHPCAAFPTTHQPPKLALHSHRNMVAFSKILMPTTDSPRPKYFLSYPFGSVQGHLAVSLCHPITRILLDERPNPPENLAQTVFLVLAAENCRIAILPPHLVHPLANFYKLDESAPKLLFVGFHGEQVSSDELAAASTFSALTIVSYVSAELLMATLNVVKPTGSKSLQGMGCPIQPGVFVKITDEVGNLLLLDCIGNLLIRSPLMFTEYLGDPEATKASFDEEGYLKTREVGYVINGNLILKSKMRPSSC